MRIHTSDKFIAWSTLVSGLTVSAVAIYYSVAGLVAIFSAAVIPIIVMGVALEVSKLAGTVWLKQNWNRAPYFIRAYLLAAIAILMLITSMGIFGFLSKAHSDQTLVSGDVQSKISLYDEKIKIERENIANAQQVIKQMDAAVNGVITTGDQEVKLRDGSTKVNSAAERSLQIRRSQAKDRALLTKQIEESQTKIVKLQEESAPIRAEVRKVEAEVGPIKYIAKLIYSDNPDTNLLEKAVTWVIIIIVVVFDPLAVILLLASQYSFQWFRKQEEENVPVIENIEPTPTEESLTTEQLDQINTMLAEHAVVNEPEIPTHTEEVPSETQPTALGGDITAPEEKPAEVVEDLPLEQWNKMIEEAEKAVEQERELEDSEILASAPETEKQAMAAWKHDNPDSNLKFQRQLLAKGIIDHLPWHDYLKPQADFVDEAAVEAKKWADENPNTEESATAKEWAEERGVSDVSWMEHDEQGNQIKRIKENYKQNAEQNERTMWQRIQDAKK